MITSRPLLAAVMIVKNEEQHLTRCLSSVRTCVDEIIIVDTGSTDNTVAIAEQFGAKVFHRIWNDDFAAARNESLTHTDAEWVLYIDADEVLTNVDRFPLRRLLTESSDVAAFGLQISPLIGWMPYTDFRLWRHDPEIKFVGDIHETTLPDIRRLADERGQRLQPIPLHMQHLGYESDQTKKHLRNLPLLERQLETTPRKINILGQLGRIHASLGNHDEAEQLLQRAVDIIREDGEKEVTDVVAYVSLAQLRMSRGEDVHDLLIEARDLHPDYLVTHLVLAQNHLAQQRYADALECGQHLRECTPATMRDSRYAYNSLMFTVWPQQIIAECMFAKGEFENAWLAYGDIVALGFPYAQVREKIRKCEQHMWGDTEDGIKSSSSPADLSDVTFLVPLRVDSGERLRNVITTTSWLLEHLDTNVVVGVADVASVQPLLDSRVEVIQIDDDPRLPFHATRIFNDLALHVTTPLLVHYDTDVIIPAEQFVAAAEMIRSNEYDVVLPYETWVGVPSEEISRLLTAHDVSRAPIGFPRSLGEPLGGCVMRSMQNFIEVGMDNEHFIGWSPEDKERIHRARVLGSRISRVPGPLFHLEHPGQTPQPYRDPYWRAGQAEFERIQTLAPEELHNEVSDWPWRNDIRGSGNSFVDAPDLTVTIPVRIDSPDRLRNLITCTNVLARQTNARVIVGIRDPESIRHLIDPRIELVVISDPSDSVFHRTRILNDLSRLATTDFIANLDCDVVVPNNQWNESLRQLRDNDYELVYPYDGVMMGVPFSYHPWLERGDFASLPLTMQQVMHPTSLGGCVIWNRQAFLDAGMENEHLISWGFDDDERFARANSLGMTVHRVNGCVYHIDHHRGVDSSPSNSYLPNNRNEFLRISEMSDEEIKREITRWSWTTHSEPSTIRILLWNDPWHAMSYFTHDDDATYVVSRSHLDLECADIIVMCLPVATIDELIHIRQRISPKQKIVGFCRESRTHTSLLQDSRVNELCDGLMTYELSSDIPLPYVPNGRFDQPQDALLLKRHHPTLISAWISSPNEMSGRTQFLEELMTHLPIDSYGQLLNNASLDHDLGEETKLEAIAAYRFTLAFENTICEDYVTEKFFQPLLAGSVPIYLGAPNIESFAPGSNCFINVNDFSGPSELAKYVRSMSDDEYMSFHQWRQAPLQDNFLRLHKLVDHSPFTRLVEWYQQLFLDHADHQVMSVHQ